MTAYNVLALLLVLVDLSCMFAVIFLERKNPASTMAWILVLLFLPVIGFFAYMFFGSGFRIKKNKSYALKAAADDLTEEYLVGRLPLEEKYTFMQEHVSLVRMLSYLQQAGDGVYTSNNTGDIYIDGKDMFKNMLEDMRHAKDHIHLLYYIFRNDALGREILSILVERARAGVDVRLMYDSVGSLLASSRMFNELVAAGGKVQAFSPIISDFSTQVRLNYRNHRKITVIDGQIGYVGGMNIGVEYMGYDKKLTPWRDTHLKISGDSVWFLQERFLLDWCYVSGESMLSLEFERFFPNSQSLGGNIGIQIVSSGPDTDKSPIKGGLLEMIYSAKKNVYIQSPYFTPDDGFLDALCNTARAGIDVRLMLPGLSDHLMVHWTTLNYARQALKAGVKVYTYNGFLHAKAVTYDGVVSSIGTSNIGNRSFLLNFEVNAFIYNAEFTERYEKIFLDDIRNCQELTLEWFERQSPIKRGIFSASRLLAPLM